MIWIFVVILWGPTGIVCGRLIDCFFKSKKINLVALRMDKGVENFFKKEIIKSGE